MAHNGEVIEERDGLRVQIVPDYSPEPPYCEGIAPMIRLWWQGYGWRAEFVEESGCFIPTMDDGAIIDAAIEAGSDRELFERYLSVYHGTRHVETLDTRGNGGGDCVYIAFNTAEWRRVQGVADDAEHTVDLSEWRAYAEGDVYGYAIEKRVTWHADDSDFDDRESWEEVESCWGFYGREYAEESAREAFEYATKQAEAS